MPTLKEIATHLELKENRMQIIIVTMMKKLLSSSFERCFNKDKEDHMEDSTAELAITMLKALKDLEFFFQAWLLWSF
jgi:hypothetical protein